MGVGRWEWEDRSGKIGVGRWGVVRGRERQLAVLSEFRAKHSKRDEG